MRQHKYKELVHAQGLFGLCKHDKKKTSPLWSGVTCNKCRKGAGQGKFVPKGDN